VNNGQSGLCEKELLRRATQGSAEAFGQIYDLHADRVFGYLYYALGDAKEAEDLTQEVFLRAWRALGRYKIGATRFIAWLLTIAHNLVADHYRARRTEAPLVTQAGASSGPGRIPEDTIARRQELRSALAKLEPTQQQLILLHLVEGFSYAELAPVLGRNPAALRVIQHRALAKLSSILEEGH
jgi:RNA polymerase sigma-70 factor (ECF subfamily)